MADTFKFPQGYDVVVYRKQDILDCIDENIIDKDVALTLVRQCEVDCADFIKQGRWAAVPFIGNIREAKNTVVPDDPEKQALIEEAKSQLDREQYVMFRKELFKEDAKKIKHNRYYKYIISIEANRNKKLFKKLCTTKGELYARIRMFINHNLKVVDNEHLNLLEDE